MSDRKGRERELPKGYQFGDAARSHVFSEGYVPITLVRKQTCEILEISRQSDEYGNVTWVESSYAE